jgi:hypothetical protein
MCGSGRSQPHSVWLFGMSSQLRLRHLAHAVYRDLLGLATVADGHTCAACTYVAASKRVAPMVVLCQCYQSFVPCCTPAVSKGHVEKGGDCSRPLATVLGPFVPVDVTQDAQELNVCGPYCYGCSIVCSKGWVISWSNSSGIYCTVQYSASKQLTHGGCSRPAVS